jgi:hypothetical protein
MTKTPNGNERLFSGLRVPEPPGDLRRQVLSRAGQTRENGAGADPWARIWESGWTRLAWAASVLVLVVCHLLLPGGDTERARERSTLAQTDSGDRDELAAIVSLPRLSLDAQPVAASIRNLRESESDPDAAAPAAVSEENAS